jgi:hypothetical protein
MEKKYKGRKCCSKISYEFKKMQADMHNLFPSIGEVNGDRSNFVFGEIDGEEREYGECDFEVAERIAEPKKSIFPYLILSRIVPPCCSHHQRLIRFGISSLRSEPSSLRTHFIFVGL